MACEKFYGICEYFFGWRCIVCGEIVDQMILENRNDFREPGVAQSMGEMEKAKNGKR